MILKDEDIQRIAQAVYGMMYNDLQEINQRLYSCLSSLSSVRQEIQSDGQSTRSDISSIQGQMYNLRRV